MTTFPASPLTVFPSVRLGLPFSTARQVIRQLSQLRRPRLARQLIEGNTLADDPLYGCAEPLAIGDLAIVEAVRLFILKSVGVDLPIHVLDGMVHSTMLELIESKVGVQRRFVNYIVTGSGFE
jgi:hypothetical protein